MAKECARCKREDQKTRATQVYKVATDEASIEDLRDDLHGARVKENLSRPSSNEAVAEAVAAAERSVEEIMAARDAESDRGVPAPDRSDLTAEEQTEVLALMVARTKRQQEAEMRASDSSVRVAGETLLPCIAPEATQNSSPTERRSRRRPGARAQGQRNASAGSRRTWREGEGRNSPFPRRPCQTTAGCGHSGC
jgi:hypothetical protein